MNDLQKWLEDNGLIACICNGTVTICDGDCENCEDSEEDPYEN